MDRQTIEQVDDDRIFKHVKVLGGGGQLPAVYMAYGYHNEPIEEGGGRSLDCYAMRIPLFVSPEEAESMVAGGFFHLEDLEDADQVPVSEDFIKSDPLLRAALLGLAMIGEEAVWSVLKLRLNENILKRNDPEGYVEWQREGMERVAAALKERGLFPTPEDEMQAIAGVTTSPVSLDKEAPCFPDVKVCLSKAGPGKEGIVALVVDALREAGYPEDAEDFIRETEDVEFHELLAIVMRWVVLAEADEECDVDACRCCPKSKQDEEGGCLDDDASAE